MYRTILFIALCSLLLVAAVSASDPIWEDASDADSIGDVYCYSIPSSMMVQSLQENRDRLINDLARRKCTDSCTLWAELNLSERYIFLMNTAYLGSPASALFPTGSPQNDTALDHATALYSINGAKAGEGIDGSGRGGNEWNRIYLGFDDFTKCLMRNFTMINDGGSGDPKGMNG